MKLFKDNINIETQIELERQLFGGSIYDSAYKFPSIYVTNIKDKESEDCYNAESFITHTELIHNLIDTCGRDLSLYFAIVYKLYEIDDDTQNAEKNKAIVTFCTDALAHLSLALNQSKLLLDKINDITNYKGINLEITGTEYCFIVMVLRNLFYYYTTIFNFILHRSYLDNDLSTNMRYTLSFIASEEFESMRKIFKVVECYKKLEPKHTFH